MTKSLDKASTAPRRPGRRRIIGVGLAILGSLALLEGVAAVMTAVVNPMLDTPILRRGTLLTQQARRLASLIDTEGREEIDRDLGWRYRRGFAAGHDTINGAGMRTSRTYARSPSTGKLRVAAFGDSYVYCNEVANPDTWSYLVEEGWDTEMLNYGVGGYGTDQAFLRYLREGMDFAPDVVLIGFAPVNLRRIVNRFRGFIHPEEGPWFKPRFVLLGDTLGLIPPPVASTADAERLIADPGFVREVGRMDHWYEPAVYQHRLYRWSPTYRLVTNFWIRLRRRYFDPDRLVDDGVFRTDSEAFRVQVAVLHAFADSVESRGARPVVLMLPGAYDMERNAVGLRSQYDPLRRELVRGGLEVLDPLDAFTASGTPIADFLQPGGHYSRAGNAVIAREVAEFLDLPRR